MTTRREFLAQAVLAAGAAAGLPACAAKEPAEPESASSRPAPAPATPSAVSPVPAAVPRVVVVRHAVLAEPRDRLDPARVRELLDEAAKALAGRDRPADAWATWFRPADRLGLKVNCLGYVTHPAVAAGLGAAVEAAGLPPSQVLVWDRLNRELQSAGYALRAAGAGARCFGTDALSARGNSGYTPDVIVSGRIGSLFSRILTDETTALVSASVLKDHNLAGLTACLKNFYGAIHNPNKYHDNNCDPFIADVAAAPPIRERLRLALCDATWPQVQGGPAPRQPWQWPYGGLILGTDPVAVDRVALEILERRRAAVGLPPLETEHRPARHLASAEARGLGCADLARIEVVSLGRPWMDLT